MNKYRIINNITNRKILLDTLGEIGIRYEAAEDETTASVIMEGWSYKTRKCNVCIRQSDIASMSRTGVFGDVGYAWNGQYYMLVADEMDLNKLSVRRIFDNVSQMYAVRAIEQMASSKGIVVRRETQSDGTLMVILTGGGA